MNKVILIVNFIVKLIVSVYSSVKKFIYQFKTMLFFKRVRKDITKLNWYMMKSGYPRHRRRQILRKIIDYTSLIDKIDVK